MAFQVTARKWRPRRFDEVVGQEHITATLSNAVRSGRIAHCYLFCGPRGVGKTTSARILAKLLNCANRDELNPCDTCPSCKSIAEGTSMDVLEIDGASNNSVEDVRELRELVRYVPTGGAYKIYIIDEVHMLSTAAFNALLKTLEEPPENVVFVFATTEVQQVPETIQSRCQRFNFRRIPTSQIASHLGLIARSEKIDADEEALYLLAHRADGALRDAESLFDQVSSFEEERITAEVVRRVLGLVDRSVFFELSHAIVNADARAVLQVISSVIDEGGDLEELVRGYAEHASYLLHAKVQGSASQLEVADAERTQYEETAKLFGDEDILRILRTILDLESDLKRSLQPRFRVEMAMVRLARMGSAVDVSELLGRLESLGAAPFAAQAQSTATGIPREARETMPQPSRRVVPPVAVAPVNAALGPPPPSSDPPAGKQVQRAERGAVLDLAAVVNQWQRITADIASTNQSVGGCLAEARPAELDGAVLHLAFPPECSFQKGLVEKNQHVVEAALERQLGTSLRVRCRLTDSSAEEVPKAETTASIDPAAKLVIDAIDGEMV